MSDPIWVFFKDYDGEYVTMSHTMKDAEEDVTEILKKKSSNEPYGIEIVKIIQGKELKIKSIKKIESVTLIRE